MLIMANAKENIKNQWHKILDIISKKIDKKIFDLFIKNSEIIEVKENILYLAVDSKLAKQILTNDYSELITNIINDHIREKIYSVFFISKNDVKINENNNLTSLFENSFINEDMNFENFVVGESNREAYEASKNILENKMNFNPLFIYSNSGLGKTHLLNAIGNEIKKNNPDKKILYTTAANFFNEYLHIIKGERIEEQFLDYFKKIDIFLIDDIHFFIGKEKCQELFFTIFSTLINNKKKVIITSDKHPNELKGLENRLITRFVGGLTVCIKEPSIETSVEIIKLYTNKINNNISIDNEVYQLIAKKFSKNIRELKGVVNKLLFFNLNIKKNNHIILNNAIEAIKDFFKKNKNIDKNKIIEIISNYYLLPSSMIIGHIKSNQVNLARHVAMFLIRNMLKISYKDIGIFFDNRNYSTILIACKKIEDRINNDLNFQIIINELKNKIKNYNNL